MFIHVPDKCGLALYHLEESAAQSSCYERQKRRKGEMFVKMTGLVLVCLLLFTENLLAQQSKESPQPDRYQIVNSKSVMFDIAILIDTWTGKTWRLAAGGSGESAWFPINRLDTTEHVKEWVKSHPPSSKK